MQKRACGVKKKVPYTVELLGLIGAVVPSLLVEDGVDGDSGLTGLTVTNDQLTLTTADGHHGVDGLVTSHHRLVDGATGENAGGLHLSTTALGGLDGTLAVNGVAESVDDTAEKGLSDGHIHNLASALDGVAFSDESVFLEEKGSTCERVCVQRLARGKKPRSVCVCVCVWTNLSLPKMVTPTYTSRAHALSAPFIFSNKMQFSKDQRCRLPSSGTCREGQS